MKPSKPPLPMPQWVIEVWCGGEWVPLRASTTCKPILYEGERIARDVMEASYSTGVVRGGRVRVREWGLGHR